MNGLFNRRWVLIVIQISKLKKLPWQENQRMRHPSLRFNNTKVFQSTKQIYLNLILDNRLSLEEYLPMMGGKIIKTIAFLRILQIYKLWLLFTKLLLVPILTTQTFLTIKLSMHHSKEKLNLFNITLVLQELTPKRVA